MVAGQIKIAADALTDSWGILGIAVPRLSGLHVQPAAFNENLCQSFRFADHEAVTGIDFDERLHSAECFNVLALQLRCDGSTPQGQNPSHVLALGAYSSLNGPQRISKRSRTVSRTRR